ncbi:MAG: sigma-70 family RNA polymerase sigma factor [Candidatus Eiseniibacteriota bacterium]|nr:MAG: sigma-70 family RNA polymerase sigma factor [Candidatus Eisenbacteria bacterium]
MAEDRILIEESLSGDQEAFRSLVNRYGGLVVHIVHRMIRNAADAEDVYQDVFLKVYQALPRFRLESKMSTWIATITYNTCVNHLRKKKEVLLGDLTEENEEGMRLRTDCPSPVERAERVDIAERLETEIGKMPPQFRTVLTLFHLEDMTYREIAQVMNLPEGTVKSHLFRARKLLRRRLAERYGEEELVP